MLQKLSYMFLLIHISLSIKSQEPDSLRKGIHQVENELNATLLSKQKQSDVKATAFPSELIITGATTLTRKVLGWHPYWASSTAHLLYEYKALSHIAYFSYEVDTATGGYTSIHDWNTTPLIDYAHQRGTKVLLTVTNFGTARNTEILSDTVKQKFLISTIIYLLKARNGDGVNFDLESVALSQRSNLVNFIRLAVTTIKAELPVSEISMATPAVDWSGSWDLASLSQLCDYLIVMGYDYYWKGSSTAGPVAPMEGENYNVSRTVNTYISAGVSPGKLLLGVPWYGYDWPVVNSSRKASATGDATARVFTAATQLAETHGKLFDQTTKVPWLSYTSPTNWRQLWFDDTESLSMKYNLVKSKDLGGIGIWALSYEGGSKEMWENIISAFSPIDESVNKIINVYPNPVLGTSKIDFFLIKKEYVTLKIFDLLGRERMVLVKGELDAGKHSEEFSITGYAAGLYLFVLQTESSKSTWRIVVTK
jgi:spore germination protein YaaH